MIIHGHKRAGWAMLLVGLLLGGCVSSNSQARKQAVDHWQNVRTGVTLQMAEQQFQKGQLDAARNSLQEALRTNPQDAQLHLLLARVMFERRDLVAAQAEVAAARRISPDLAEVDYWQGVLAQAVGQWEEAHAAYQAACTRASDSAEYLAALLEAKLVLGQAREAADLAMRRFRDFPRDARLRMLAGGALLLAGDLPQAETIYQQAADLDPASDPLKQALVRVYCMQNKYEQAAPLLEGLLARADTDRDDLRLMLATCRLRCGHYSDAITLYETCMAAHPDQPAIQLHLLEARLLAGQVEQARQQLQALLQQRPDDPSGWELLGHAHALSGDLKRARQAYAYAAEHGGDGVRLREYMDAIDRRAAAAGRDVSGEPHAAAGQEASPASLAVSR